MKSRSVAFLPRDHWQRKPHSVTGRNANPVPQTPSRELKIMSFLEGPSVELVARVSWLSYHFSPAELTPVQLEASFQLEIVSV